MQAHLCKVAQTKMSILEQHPLTLHSGAGHVLPGNYLLPLTHAHTQGLDLLLLGKVLSVNSNR